MSHGGVCLLSLPIEHVPIGGQARAGRSDRPGRDLGGRASRVGPGTDEVMEVQRLGDERVVDSQRMPQHPRGHRSGDHPAVLCVA